MVVGACSPSHSGDWGRRIPWTQEVEGVLSQDGAIALQPGGQEWNSSKKKKKKKERKKKGCQSVISLGPTLIQHDILTNSICKDAMSKSGYIHRDPGLELEYIFLEGTV